MKRLLLMLAAGAIAAGTYGQERTMTVAAPAGTQVVDKARFMNELRARRATNNASKTTAAPRWYSYDSWFDANETDMSSSTALSLPYLWKDTMAVMAYSSSSGGTEWHNNTLVSVGTVIDPAFSGFNDITYYTGDMEVTSTDAYGVDSVVFFGRYGFNPAKTSVVDTLRVAFVYGDGASTSDIYLAKTTNPVVLSNYGVATGDSLHNYRMIFDSSTTHAGGTTVVVRDVILDNSGASPAWGDTMSDGTFVGAVAVGSTPGASVSIPAGNMIGASITFISGDPTFTANDTVFGSTIGYKYNMFRPYVMYRGTTSTPVRINYDINNRNDGMFKTLPDTALGWGGQYIPLYFWSSTGGAASGYQFPYIDFHLTCSTCGVVSLGVSDVNGMGKVSAYPNPVRGDLRIPFELNDPADVAVTLSNMTGQVVRTRLFVKTGHGEAVFDTRDLADGLYFYSVSANGQRFNGRVVVLH